MILITIDNYYRQKHLLKGFSLLKKIEKEIK